MFLMQEKSTKKAEWKKGIKRDPENKVVQRRRWRWDGTFGEWEPLRLKKGEKESPCPQRKGKQDGEIVNTAIALGIIRAQDRRKKNPERRRTRSDSYMYAPLLGKTYIETPFQKGEEEPPYMTKGRFPGPYIKGKNQPKYKGKPSTRYQDMAEILDSWCESNEDKRKNLIQEMLRFMESNDPIVPSELFSVEGDSVEEDLTEEENARRAAKFFVVIMTAAEPHVSRANPDGGKFARACLRRGLEGETFVKIVKYFLQAQQRGNQKFRDALEKHGFDEKLELSDDSDEEVAEDSMIDEMRERAPVPREAGSTAPPPETDIEQVSICPTGLASVDDPDAPGELKEIQEEWRRLAGEYIAQYGIAGEPVEGAAFLFVYQGIKCKMPIGSGRMEGSCSWEYHIDTIRQKLSDLGAEKITFYPGKSMGLLLFGFVRVG